MASPVPPPRLPPDSATRPSSSAPLREHVDAEVRAVDTTETTTETGGDLPSGEQRNPDLYAHFSAVPPTVDRLRRPEADASCPPASARQQPFGDSTSAALKERAESMFLRGESAPLASGHPPAAAEATYQLVIDVNTVVRELWSDHSDAIKRRCAPEMPKGLIAMQEVFGFVLADALGRPLLPADRAMRVGLSGDNALRSIMGAKSRKGQLPAARETAAEAVRKAKRVAQSDPSLLPRVAAAQAAGEAAIAAVLAKAVELDLPNETVGKRKRADKAAAADEEATQGEQESRGERRAAELTRSGA